MLVSGRVVRPHFKKHQLAIPPNNSRAPTTVRLAGEPQIVQLVSVLYGKHVFEFLPSSIISVENE